MPRQRDEYTPLQALYLLRFARLIKLYRHETEQGAPDEHIALVRRALHSTLVDCIHLNVEPEAEALLGARDRL
jgi:hypothetical protein